MDRRQRMLSGLNLSGLGLEIGGGYNPLVAGEPGLNVRTLDHLGQVGLIEKYAAQGAPTDRIQPVDYVWSGQRYPDLVGETRFDWIVASHVIEHVPDVIAFLNQCGKILKPDGVLSLAVPDRRYTFDYYRPVSSLREMVDAHLQKRTVSSPGAVAEHFLYLSRLEGRDVWEAGAGQPRLALPPEGALGPFWEARQGRYVDIHAWVFTPSSFRLFLHDVAALGLTTMRERAFHDSVGCEFFVQCGPGAAQAVDRDALARALVAEQGPEL